MRRFHEWLDRWIRGYWPVTIGLLISVGALAIGYVRHSPDWAKFIDICCIVSISRSGYTMQKWRKKHKAECEKFAEFLSGVMREIEPQMRRIFEEEVLRQGVSKVEAAIMAKARIEILLHQELESRRSRFFESNSDKP